MELPLKPDESDCCNSGCSPCILDIYEEQLKNFERKTRTELNLNLFKNCLITTAYSSFKVKDIEKHSSDALLITFEFLEYLKGSENINNFRVIYNPGQYFMLKAKLQNEEFQRSYTPIPINTSNELQFTMLIKLYEIGQMSKYIKNLKIGSKTIWRGPYGHFSINYSYKHIVLIAQGVGIAPLYSIIYNILKNENCDTFLKLYFCCKRCDTIYLRNYLYDLQSNWNFSYEVFLSTNENITNKYNETIHKHKFDYNLLKNYLLDKFKSTQVLICGSKNFMSNFKDIVVCCNVEEKNIFLF